MRVCALLWTIQNYHNDCVFKRTKVQDYLQVIFKAINWMDPYVVISSSGKRIGRPCCLGANYGRRWLSVYSTDLGGNQAIGYVMHEASYFLYLSVVFLFGFTM